MLLKMASLRTLPIPQYKPFLGHFPNITFHFCKKRAAAIAVNVQSITVDVEDDQDITGACATGKVVRMKDGNGSYLDRSECGKTLFNHIVNYMINFSICRFVMNES